jgi:hypothetical protein
VKDETIRSKDMEIKAWGDKMVELQKTLEDLES